MIDSESDDPIDPVEAIFHQAVERAPGDEREAYLNEACGGDSALRAKVGRLLVAEADGDRFLTDPTLLAQPLATEPDGLVGTEIGSYKVLEAIGEGGYGVVYLAEQRRPMTRRVALKVIKAGMDTKQVIARFEAERQALAMMEHPNIARVLDAGATDAGRPYFVMELVRGVPITEYCRQAHCSTEQRLRLFIDVCRAVQHAHQKGIIHRDLKPSNILVTLHDGVPVPKIIDFGIAKAMNARLTDKTLFTAFHQFIGTPAYTSPEQVEMSGLDIDTRSDIYSLGVLLYELLTGTTPIETETLQRAAFEEIRRTIRETEPPKPSTRMTDLRNRGLGNSELSMPEAVIDRELDWIVMKALDKDRERRYGSATAFQEDIQRFIDNEPVFAAAPGASYQLRKFAQRHRTAALAIMGIALALILGTSIAVYGMLRAIDGKRQAETAGKEAREAEALAQSEKRRTVSEAYVADMRLAHEGLNRKDFAFARYMLSLNQAFPPDHDPRHWEWRALWQRCQPKAALRFGIKGDHHINSISISLDGQSAAVSSRASIRVWDLRNGGLIETLDKPADWSDVAFSPAGDTLYASFNEVIRSYKMPGFTEQTKGFIHDREVFRMAVSPDGRWLAALCRLWNNPRAQLSIWDLKTGLLHQRWDGLTAGYSGRLSFSRDSRLLGVGLEDSLRVIAPETGEDTTVIYTPAHLAMALSPDGQFVASSDGARLNIHRLADRTLVKASDEHLREIVDLAYSPDGRFIASASSDMSVILWDAITFWKLASIHDPDNEVSAVRFTPDSRRMLVAELETMLHVWEIPEHFQSQSQSQSTWPILGDVASKRPHSQICYSADGRLLAATAPQAGVTLRSPDTLQVTRTLNISASGVRCSPVDPDLIAVGSQKDGGLALIHAVSGEELNRVTVLTDLSSPGEWTGAGQDANAVFPVGFSQNGERLLVVARMKPNVSRCVIYRVSDLSEVGSWILRSNEIKESPSAALSPDGTRVVASGYWGLRLLTLGQAAENTEVLFKGNHLMQGLDYSPDGQILAVGGSRKKIYLLNPKTGQTMAELIGHFSSIAALRFSPDGRRLASLASDKLDAVKIWDVATGREILTLETAGDWNRQIEWSPDGNAILVIGGNGATQVWRVPSVEEIEKTEGTR